MVVDKPEITESLAAKTTVTQGRGLTLAITVSKPANADSLTYAWTRDGKPVTPADTDNKFEVASANRELHAGSYVVTVVAEKGTEKSEPASSSTTVVFEDEDKPAVALVWDAAFAKTALVVAGSVVASVFVLLVIGIVRSIELAQMVIVGLLLLASACAATGIALALIDARGRARATDLAAGAGGRAWGTEFVKVLPDTLKNWGTLGLASAILALAAVAMISASVVGWRSLPDPKPATTPTPTPSATATPSGASSAPSASPS